MGLNFREYRDPARAVGYKQGIFLIKPANLKVKLARLKFKHITQKYKQAPTYILSSASLRYAEHNYQT
jgi:hypothetical protein